MDRLAVESGLQALDPATLHNWPDTIPVVRAPWSLVCGPDGTIAVRLNLSATSKTQAYDIVGHSGNRVSEVVLPLASRVIGFGAGYVYLALVDSDHMQHIERRSWPLTAN